MEKKNLNHIVKEKIKQVEHKIIPGIQWNKEDSWNKIKDILNSKNKQLIMWYFATAASVSVLVAATLDNTLPVLQQFLPKMEVSESLSTQVQKQDIRSLQPQQIERKSLELDNLQIKVSEDPLYEESFRNCTFKDMTIPSESSISSPPQNESKPAKPLQINVHANANKLTGITTGISLKYQYVLKSDARKTQYVSLGTYTSMIISPAKEQKSERFYPATFINATYGQRGHSKRGGEWEIGAGYLLNPNEVIYKDTTVRFHYTRTVLGRLKVGPELILTNNLTKVFPGFTLAFG